LQENYGHIYLTGYSGCGKTVTGIELASRLRRDYIDLDEEIKNRSGMPILDFFRKAGLHEFREFEKEILIDLAGRSVSSPSVIALGGGSLVERENQALIKNSGILLWLRVKWTTLFRNVHPPNTRPVVRYSDNYNEFISLNRDLYRERVTGYSNCDLVIDADTMTPSDTTTSIIRLMDSSWFLTVKLGERTHPVICDSGSLARAGQILYHLGLLPRSLVWIITTHTLDRDELPLARIVREDIEQTRQQVKVLRIPDGESAKNNDEISRIHEAMIGAGTTRDDLVIAIGGGTLTDVAGFAASTYLRGIDIIHVPTTLVGMVDAAIGGKTAVNHERGKNLIGSFHQPKAVLIDPVVLNTSADDYFLAGLAELVKYGCVADSSIIDDCEKYWSGILNRPTWEEKWTRDGWGKKSGDPWVLISLIKRGLSIKADVVSADEFDCHGERIILNFGHSFAHAFEVASGFSIPHGQAVALGIRADYRIAKNRGMVTDAEVRRLDKILSLLGPNTLLKNLDETKILSAVKYDKKHGMDGLRYVLPAGIGQTKVVQDVTSQEMSRALKDLRSISDE
jgi:3-dehydroquinate synthase